MSNNIIALPAASVLFGLAFVGAIQMVSSSQTAAHLERFAEARAAEEAARERERVAFVEAWNKRKEKARAAVAAAAREEMLAALPGNPKMGRIRYMTCLGCHGLQAEGSRAFKAPRLAGQTPWYLKTQLTKFKEGLRGAHPSDLSGAQMAPMARMLVGTAADDVIAYIASLDPGKPADRGAGDAAAGKELYAVCATCHGRAAEGQQVQKAPRLAHQHAWYLERQLGNFRGGVRGAHAADTEGQRMAEMAKSIADDAAIANLIAFIQSLER